MSQRFEQFQAAFQEDACLEALMRAREGGVSIACKACGKVSAFVQRPKLRAYACGHCNYLIYPAAGTPLESRRTSLQLWLFAIKLLTEQGAKAAAGLLEREAKLSSLAARRMVDELAALKEKAGGDGPPWLAVLAKRVADKPPAPAVAVISAKAKPGLTDDAPGQAKPVGVQPAAQLLAEAPPSTARKALLALAAGGGVVALVVAAGFAIATLRPQAAREDVLPAEDAPALQAVARPSLILSSVESDLEAARQATQFALRNDPSLANIREQVGNAPEAPAVAAPVLPPSNIILVPPRVPVTQIPPKGQAPQAPVTASGDPDQLLTFGPIRIRRHLVDMIVRAGRVVGADPTLLMAVADKESAFSTAVQAKTSSATGLYQFIEQTWLGVIYEFGTKHGLVNEVRQIGRSGRQFTIADASERQRILDMRREPYISALLAAEMLKRDTLRLEKAMGRHLTGGEIYLIHFLGPDAAQTFIETMEETPGTKAADLLPRPAQANRPIFYADAGGETKTLSVSEVHKKFNDMIKLRLDRYGDVRKLWGAQAAQRPGATK
ncbi:hypothetical protein DWF00_17365 [Bosea caraganae]|uniref:Transglycosylase SLT domain-containing protein n=1 Tax=Bosea caraganae TaxID=2763117 RepID=A0A370L7C5_9HYPH|nr:transglycosylase SLT domain-containing protein [Bosea caraganae]RDJ24978.1 hypothetical protein DWF00_17365 [Bosea caraganae]RDJ26089.1 hypothetical protein DWE98_09585 [Bosea caraganae]